MKKNSGKLKILIMLMMLVLAVMLLIVLKPNSEKIQRETAAVATKLEKKEKVQIKKLEIVPFTEEIAEEAPEENNLKTEEDNNFTKAEDEGYFERIRKKQIQQLREDAKEYAVAADRMESAAIDVPASSKNESAEKPKHNIRPSEDDIRKLENEKMLLY